MTRNLVKKEIINRKEFFYSKEGVKLNFTLNVNNSLEIKPFKECLEEAIRDLSEIIKDMKN